MTNDRTTRALDVLRRDFQRLSVGAWIAIVVLLGLLMAAIVGVYFSGTEDLAAGMSGAGVLAMTLGVLFTIAIGVGLMALIFYSSRRGYDEAPSRDPTDKKHDT
jgi:ABC-type Na+ efflux pump permease subunit